MGKSIVQELVDRIEESNRWAIEGWVLYLETLDGEFGGNRGDLDETMEPLSAWPVSELGEMPVWLVAEIRKRMEQYCAEIREGREGRRPPPPDPGSSAVSGLSNDH